MSQASSIQLVLMVVALCAASALAASIKEPLAKAHRLLKLVEIVNKGDRPTVEDVVEAYKEYVHLYESQTNLASGFEGANGKKVGFEDKYEQISQLLSQSGLETITQDLFVPFDSVDAEKRLVVTDRMRKNIESAIKGLYGQ